MIWWFKQSQALNNKNRTIKVIIMYIIIKKEIKKKLKKINIQVFNNKAI